MAKSLQDQLLNVGLATEEQLEKAKQSKRKPKAKPFKKKSNNHQKPHNKAKKAKKPASDLAQFYNQRSSFEKQKQDEEEKQRKEAARLKKLNKKKIRKLLLDSMQNVEDAEVRYNFVVGTSVKYLYVTEPQQEALSNGELAITFLGGRRCLISLETVDQLRELEPTKLIIIADSAEGLASKPE